MKPDRIPQTHRWLLSIGAPTLVCCLGWHQVITQNQQLQYKAVRSHQVSQRRTLKLIARLVGNQLAQAHLSPSITSYNNAQKSGVVTLLNEFNQVEESQLSVIQTNNKTGLTYSTAANLESPFTSNPVNHRAHGIDPLSQAAIMQSRDGVFPVRKHLSWHKPRPHTINSWTTIELVSPVAATESWKIISSDSLPEVLRASGTDQQMHRAIVNMSVFTGGMVILAGMMLRFQRKQKRYESEVVAQLLDTDPLTGLINRRKFQQRGSQALRQLHDEQSLALIILNLDRFRPINDLLGPEAGDELLIKVATRLQNCLRQEDLLARLSGDEFAVLLHNSGDYNAQVCAERLLRELDHPFWINGRANHISGSIGITTTKNSELTFSQFLSQSDAAMCRTKSQQQGGYTLFNASMYSETMNQLSLEADLRRAIERHELRVYYQPIVDLKTRQTKGYEALVRWQHRQRGLLHPGTFLPIASAIGWTISMERWVLRQACVQMNAWYGQQQPEIVRPSVSVNISAQHLAQACLPHYDLVGYIEKVLQETGWPAESLTLEITEDALINSAEAVAEQLSAIQSLGVRISLDDFGTGYSSLSYLQHFPVDILKIDKSFIRTIHDRMQNGEIVRTIISLANSLGVSTIAEGIETQEQLDQLQSLQCQYGQGFLFSQPLKHLGPDRRVQSIPPTSIMTSLTP